jgi:hypothetical protein
MDEVVITLRKNEEGTWIHWEVEAETEEEAVRWGHEVWYWVAVGKTISGSSVGEARGSRWVTEGQAITKKGEETAIRRWG